MTHTDIWRVDLSAEGNKVPVNTISSTRMDSFPAISPDGRRLAFTSLRSGRWEVWVQDDGRAARSLGPSSETSVKWSPDGQRIATVREQDGQRDIFVIDAETGVSERLTHHPARDGAPSWSPDGSSIYFTSERTGRPEVWRMDDNGGSPVQVTRKGGMAPQLSPEGEYLYYAKRGASGAWRTGLWRQRVHGGAEELILDSIWALQLRRDRTGSLFHSHRRLPVSEF